MQTFLPYPDFLLSAKALDKKRCWKQVIEASQILDVLEGRKTGWANHPAVKMWVGHRIALREYFNAFLHICKTKHGINTKYKALEVYNGAGRYPWWLGRHKFHRAMRARLIEKNEEFYLPIFGEKDKGYNDGKYWWPNMENGKFKAI